MRRSRRGAEEAFPGRSGERRMGLFETPRGRVKLKYEVIDGQPVFEGDILLPAEAGNPRVRGEHPKRRRVGCWGGAGLTASSPSRTAASPGTRAWPRRSSIGKIAHRCAS